MKNNKEFKDLVEDIRSLPEPDYGKKFNREAQDEIHNNLIRFAEERKKKKLRSGRLNRVTGGLVGAVALLIFTVLIMNLGENPRTAQNPDTVNDSAENTREEKDISSIKTVLNNTFIGPNSELERVLKAHENATTDPEAAETLLAIGQYSFRTFEPYFSEAAYSEYFRFYGITFLQAAYQNGYQLQINKMDIEKKGNRGNTYNFEMKIQYQKGGNSETIVITGETELNENGKITHMLIRDDGLMESLKQ
ncbi:hypothetical protein ACFO3D_15465 [Virgibacillus kekensis]|uniref:Uncharacterized protein n=1 Tax=Virgibacillus kekensis TaxID=202261 RepID=A0ABV9DN41_9BACI